MKKITLKVVAASAVLCLMILMLHTIYYMHSALVAIYLHLLFLLLFSPPRRHSALRLKFLSFRERLRFDPLL